MIEAGTRLRAGLTFGSFLFFTAAILYHADGASAWLPFLNVEALGIVVLGTFLSVWAAYPFRKVLEMRDSVLLDYAARSAVTMGWIGTLIGIMLMLSDITEVDTIPRRTALALTAIFYGWTFSEFILRPLAQSRRLAKVRAILRR